LTTAKPVDDERAKEMAEKTFEFLIRLVAAFFFVLALFLGYDMFAPLFHLPSASFAEVLGFGLTLVSLVGIVRLGI
jgi:hypothetical protein